MVGGYPALFGGRLTVRRVWPYECRSTKRLHVADVLWYASVTLVKNRVDVVGKVRATRLAVAKTR